MRFFSSLERKDAATRRASSSPYFAFGFPYYSNWSVQRAVKDGYERVIWVFRAVNAIASNASRLPISLRQGAEDGPEVKPEAISRILNRHANPFESAAVFRYRLSSQLLLSKRGVFVEVVRDRAGRPKQLTLLPPEATAPVPDRDDFLKGFQVIVGGEAPQFVPWKNPKGQENVLWIKLPHPTDPYSGSTPMEAAGLSIDLDYYARLYNRTFLQNDGRPGGILGVKGEIEEDDADELKRRFGGNGQAGRVSVIEADQLSWVDTATTPRDAQYVQGRTVTKEDILMAFGVPESVIGNASGRTFDNAEAERLVFWMETMPPHLDLLAGFYDYLTEGGIDDDVFVVHDTSSVDVLQKLKRDVEEHELAMVKGSMKKIDEGRVRIGLDPVDVPGTRALYVPNTMKAIGQDDADAEALGGGGGATPPQLLPFTGQTPTDKPTGSSDSSDGPIPDVPAGDELVAAALSGTRWEKAVRLAVDRCLRRQEKVVLERLRGTKALKHTRYWDVTRAAGDTAHWVGDRPVSASYLLDGKRWDAEMADEVEPVLRDLFIEAGVGDVPADEWIKDALGTLAAVNRSTTEAIAEAVSDVDEPETLDRLVGRISSVFADAVEVRSADVARAFVGAAVKAAARVAAEAATT